MAKGWIAYVVAWSAVALFWMLAAASGLGRPPIEALPEALITMGTAGVMGVFIWRLTNRVAWDARAASFYVAHVLGMIAYSVVYATSMVFPDIVAGHVGTAFTTLIASRVLIWSLLMGSWLYLMVAGIAYAIRGQRRARTQEAATAE